MLIVCGSFPPPLHGMAAVNMMIFDRASARHAPVYKLDLAPSGLSRGLAARSRKLIKLLVGVSSMTWLVLRYRRGCLYVGLSAGLGQIVELPMVVIARLAGWRVAMHHHSFAYLDRPSLVSRILFRIAGCSALHITLCSRMHILFNKVYGSKLQVKVLSNAALFSNTQPPPVRNVIRTIGFLSNISFEKGIADFFATIERLRNSGVDVFAKIAGPFVDDQVKRFTFQEIDRLGCIEYVGPVYGNEKDLFYQNIDILLFPSRYRNEAEPLTIFESLSHGVPVVATGRGCIPDISNNVRGVHVVPIDSLFSEIAGNLIKGWMQSGNYSHLSTAAFNGYENTTSAWKNCLDDLLDELLKVKKNDIT